MLWSSTETRSICSIALEKEAPKQKDRKRRWKLWFLEVEVADHQRRGCSSLFRHWTSWLIFTIIPARYPGRVIKINHFQRSSHDPTAAIWIANQWEGVCASDALWFIILLHLFAFWHLPMGMLLFGDRDDQRMRFFLMIIIDEIDSCWWGRRRFSCPLITQ